MKQGIYTATVNGGTPEDGFILSPPLGSYGEVDISSWMYSQLLTDLYLLGLNSNYMYLTYKGNINEMIIANTALNEYSVIPYNSTVLNELYSNGLKGSLQFNINSYGFNHVSIKPAWWDGLSSPYWIYPIWAFTSVNDNNGGYIPNILWGNGTNKLNFDYTNAKLISSNGFAYILDYIAQKIIYAYIRNPIIVY